MAEIEQNAGARELTVSNLRRLPRAEIENLVTSGLLPADVADEALSEQDRQQQENQQPYNNALQSQIQSRKEKRDKVDDYWLENMSASYQQEYHQLMDTYDRNESEYTDIKTRAERLKDRERDNIKKAYRFGVQLPDGRMAFFDRRQNAFVDASLQPLQGDDAKMAADEFRKLSPKEQRANTCYADACHAYAKADDISQAADAGVAETEHDKDKLAHSNGTISEDQMKELGATNRFKVENLSQRLNDAEQTDADLDAALSDDSIPASRDDSVSFDTESKSAPSNTSFASTLDGSGNGKTSATFNAVAPVTVTDSQKQNAPGFGVHPSFTPSTSAF